ncbi:hypothetical protein [Ruminococcus flavefaciens]|uniref:Uncharacterized protein n=1 Tax=Ruminococcus flavefaciens TaxID=1265 RepID=A0A1M7IFG0_RUMFL|nr:hypothetical protein [Ruminococcus flavefaciens]SHM39405.1 hypothetical protein SAMN04487860_10483 [Ruminococcus flavefaciens]
MSKSITIQIQSFPAGWFVSWNATSQCYNTGTVQIKSGGAVLQTLEKNNHSTSLQQLGCGCCLIPSQNMEIVITVDEDDKELDQRLMSSSILGKKGQTVGTVIGICVEDGYDEDYNDFFICLSGWASKD